jgi:hypothetical protein
MARGGSRLPFSRHLRKMGERSSVASGRARVDEQGWRAAPEAYSHA